MQTLFIADLHLSDDTPDLTALFVQFLRDHAANTAALYILGDFFEAWTGDDDDSHTAQQIAHEIKLFSQNAPVYFIAGNRDFLLGNEYANRANMRILPEQSIISLNQQNILITHGDEMCSDDKSYQRFRAIIRNRWLDKILLSLPFLWRKRIAQKMRQTSQQRKQQSQNYALSDVTETGVQTVLAKYSDINVIIHGHTHRPNIHIHQCNNRQITRYVLPDWKDGQGGYLAVDETGFQFFRLPENSSG